MEEVKWDEVKQECRKAIAHLNNKGIELTLRTLFYHLVERNVLPPSSKYYHLLSSRLESWGEGCSEGPKKWIEKGAEAGRKTP